MQPHRQLKFPSGIEDRDRKQASTLTPEVLFIIANLKEWLAWPYAFEIPSTLSRPTITCGVHTSLKCCVGFWVPRVKISEHLGQDSELQVSFGVVDGLAEKRP